MFVQHSFAGTAQPGRPASRVAREDGRIKIRPLEAIDGTPVVDIKPVIPADEGR